MNAGRRTRTNRIPVRRWLAPGLALALALGGGSASAQLDAGRVAYVDTQRLLDNAPQILAARTRLQQEFDRRDSELKAEQARLAALDQRAQAEAATLAEPDLTALKRQADALRRSIERTQQRLREELNTRSDEEVDRVWPLISEVVAEYAREAGYDLVLQSPVVYASGRVDITERVLDRLKRDFAQTQAQP
jgi:outer membrane protein